LSFIYKYNVLHVHNSENLQQAHFDGFSENLKSRGKIKINKNRAYILWKFV